MILEYVTKMETVSQYFSIFDNSLRIQCLPNSYSFVMTVLLSALIAAADDSSLGKVDISVLSDQVRMELLFQGMVSTEGEYLDADGSYLDCREWQDIKCDPDDNVVEIKWWYFGNIRSTQLNGTLCTDLFPASLTRFEASGNRLHGSLHLESLSERMRHFLVNYNNFTGSACLTQLPKALVSLEAGHNQLCGSIDLRDLSRNLMKLDLEYNSLSGSLDLTALTPSLRKLNCSHNAFTGSISLQSFNEGFEDLLLFQNQLSGTLCFEGLPKSLQNLNVGYNLFSGSLIVPSFPENIRCFQVSGNALAGTAVLPVKVRSVASIVLYDTSISSIVTVNGKKPRYRVNF